VGASGSGLDGRRAASGGPRPQTTKSVRSKALRASKRALQQMKMWLIAGVVADARQEDALKSARTRFKRVK
jgi:hypothetical protein